MAHITDRWHRKDRTRTDRYGRGLRWQVEWTDGTGAKRKRSFEHKVLAEDFLTELRHEQKRGVYRAPTRAAVTVDAMVAAWRDSDPTRAPGTVRTITASYRSLFQAALGHRPAHQVTRTHVQDAVNAALLDHAAQTVRGGYGLLGSAFRWADAEDLIPENPCRSIRLPRVPRKTLEPLTLAQVQTIIDAMRVPAVAAMVHTAATTGLRPGELRAVTWSRLKGSTLLVDRQLDPAGDFAPLKTPASLRRLALDPETLALLAGLRREHGEGRDRLVFHHDGAPYKARALNRAWELMRERTGITASGFHQLRHFHASRLIAAGFSPVAVARRLGHKDATETLRTYAHMWPADDAAMASAAALTLPSPSEGPILRVI